MLKEQQHSFSLALKQRGKIIESSTTDPGTRYNELLEVIISSFEGFEERLKHITEGRGVEVEHLRGIIARVARELGISVKQVYQGDFSEFANTSLLEDSFLDAPVVGSPVVHGFAGMTKSRLKEPFVEDEARVGSATHAGTVSQKPDLAPY